MSEDKKLVVTKEVLEKSPNIGKINEKVTVTQEQLKPFQDDKSLKVVEKNNEVKVLKRLNG